MKTDAKRRRHDQIAQAAYALLDQNGFAGTSMLAIAKGAHASNETLYNWYGDKIGLFRALVNDNTQTVRDTIQTALNNDQSSLDTLALVGPLLLEMLLSDRAIALNRAAAADATGVLGQAISNGGRETIAPLIGKLIGSALASGELQGKTAEELTNLYITLLVGDQQIRRVIGALALQNAVTCQSRATTALNQLRMLHGALDLRRVDHYP